MVTCPVCKSEHEGIEFNRFCSLRCKNRYDPNKHNVISFIGNSRLLTEEELRIKNEERKIRQYKQMLLDRQSIKRIQEQARIRERNRINKELIDLRVLIRQVECSPITSYITYTCQYIDQLEYIKRNVQDGYNYYELEYIQYGTRFSAEQMRDKKYIYKKEQESDDEYDKIIIKIGQVQLRTCADCGRFFKYTNYGGRKRKFCISCKPSYWKRYTREGWIGYDLQGSRYNIPNQ